MQMVQTRDGQEDKTHVVAIADRWIFDPNATQARPLTRAGLDACCLGGATYHRAAYAARFKPSKKLLKQLREDR